MQPTFHDICLDDGSEVSRKANALCRETYGVNPFVTVHDWTDGNFRGPRGWTLNTNVEVLKGAIETATADGIGTKVALTNLAGFHRQEARNLVAMSGGDITRWGGCRTLFVNVLDVAAVGKAGDEVRAGVEQLFLGLRDVAREQRFVLFNGEVAELGQFVGSVDPALPLRYNWCGVMLGVYHRERLINGIALRPGQVVVALEEIGFRSNGFTTVRGAFTEYLHEGWWMRTDPAILRIIEAAASPSVIYDAFLEDANGWHGRKRIPVAAIAHLSGGGIPEKLGALLLQSNVSAVLDDLYVPPRVMQHVVEWARLSPTYAYERFNGGQGALAIMEPEWVDTFRQLAATHGIGTRVCGRVTPCADAPSITIHSKYRDQGVLEFVLRETKEAK